jgi:hypothetical protein
MTTQSETVTFVPPPVITLVNPSTGHQGQQNLSVTVTGQFTHFAQGSTVVSFGAGITVVSLTVNAATSATALLNIDPAAAVGARTITLTTGTEVVSLNNGFSVLGGQLTLSVQPPVSPTFQSSQVIAGSLANGIGQTALTIAGGASGASQQLPTGQTQFGLSVPLRPNAENLLNVTATDASGQTASANNLKILQLSLADVVTAQVTAQRLSTAEVKALVANGTINITNPSNFNVSMFAVALTIGGRQASVSVPVISAVGELFALGPPVTISCQTPGKDIEQNGNTILVPCKGPPPLNVTVEMPASVTIGVPYTLKVNVQNASTSLDAPYTSLELDLSGANVVDPTTGLPLPMIVSTQI